MGCEFLCWRISGAFFRQPLVLGQYEIWSKITVFAVGCNISHNVEYPTTAMASSGFYFKKKINARLLWGWKNAHCFFWRAYHRLTGMMQAALYTYIDNLVSEKNASSPIEQYFLFKAGENGEFPRMIILSIAIFGQDSIAISKFGYSPSLSATQPRYN